MTIPPELPDDPFAEDYGLVEDAPQVAPEQPPTAHAPDLPRPAELLRYYRETAGWSQHDLAWHSHVDQSTISQIESGKRRPHNGTLEALSKTLAVPLEADWQELYDWLITTRDNLQHSPKMPEEIKNIAARVIAYPAPYRKMVITALVALSGTFHDIYKRWVNR